MRLKCIPLYDQLSSDLQNRALRDLCIHWTFPSSYRNHVSSNTITIIIFIIKNDNTYIKCTNLTCAPNEARKVFLPNAPTSSLAKIWFTLKFIFSSIKIILNNNIGAHPGKNVHIFNLFVCKIAKYVRTWGWNCLPNKLSHSLTIAAKTWPA